MLGWGGAIERMVTYAAVMGSTAGCTETMYSKIRNRAKTDKLAKL